MRLFPNGWKKKVKRMQHIKFAKSYRHIRKRFDADPEYIFTIGIYLNDILFCSKGKQRHNIGSLMNVLYSTEDDRYFFVDFYIYSEIDNVGDDINDFMHRLVEEYPEIIRRIQKADKIDIRFFKTFINQTKYSADKLNPVIIVKGIVKADTNRCFCSKYRGKTFISRVPLKPEFLSKNIVNNMYLAEVYDKNSDLYITDLMSGHAVKISFEDITLNKYLKYTLNRTLFDDATDLAKLNGGLFVLAFPEKEPIQGIITDWLEKRE